MQAGCRSARWKGVPRSRKHSPRGGLPFLLLVLALAGALALWRQVAFDPATDGVENALLDLRFRLRGPVPPPPEVVLLAIDERTVGRIGTMAPLRTALAKAVERITEDAPTAIAVNLLLLGKTAGDARLAGALAADDRTLLAVASTLTAEPGNGPLHPELEAALDRSRFPIVAMAPADAPSVPAGQFLLPHPGLAAASRLAHVNIGRSDDRVARQVPLALPLEGVGSYLPALPLAAARLHPGMREMLLRPGERVSLGGLAIPLTPSGQVTLDHYGPAGSIDTVSLADLLDGALPEGFFSGRIVFIGATAESLGDQYATPFGADVPGVEVLATLAANIVQKRIVRRDTLTGLWSIALALALSGLAWRAARLRRPFLAVAATAGLWLAGMAILQLAFASGGLWLDAVSVLGALFLGTALSGGFRYLADIRSTDRLNREHERLSYYLSPIVAKSLAQGGAESLDGQTRTAAILFVDLAGYTALAERMAPQAVSDLLTRLHAHIDRAVTTHGGVVVEFLGDGALAAFGLRAALPEDSAQGAVAAMECARALLNRDSPDYPRLEEAGPLRLRVSIHHGPVGLAVVGGRAHGHLTITGDTVNVASRLQDVAKQYGVTCVASREAVLAAGPAASGFEFLDRITMRGRRQQTEVWTPAPASTAEARG